MSITQVNKVLNIIIKRSTLYNVMYYYLLYRQYYYLDEKNIF